MDDRIDNNYGDAQTAPARNSLARSTIQFDSSRMDIHTCTSPTIVMKIYWIGQENFVWTVLMMTMQCR